MIPRLLLVAAALCALVAPTIVRADTAVATVQGTVRTAAGAPVAGAQVIANGPAQQTTTSDATGAFVLTLPQGVYRVSVNKGGYLPASIDDLVLVAGQTEALAVSLTEADLSSLRTIARVSSRGRASSINAGAAASAFVARVDIVDLANPQINEYVQRIPGASVSHGSSSPNTTISLGGSQSYETQVLLDGHPLSGGRYGSLFTQFVGSYLLDGVETQMGPGNTTPFAGTAVGGTANLLTPSFTKKSTFEFTTGLDSYGSQFSSLLATGSFGKFSYVAGGGSSGVNGPFQGENGCVLSTTAKATWNTPASTGIITFCGPIGSAYGSRGQVGKLRYDFSPSTSIEFGYLSTQSSYLPQATAYGVDAGGVPIAQCINSTSGGIHGQVCSSPYYSQYIGKPTQGYFFYPGSNVYNVMPIFEGQFRTAIGDNTLLIRPYQGAISRVIDGLGESNYPQFWYPSGLAAGFCSGSPSYGKPGPTVNGYTECFQGPYSTWEHDKFKGTTVSFIHPFGQNSLNFTYDYHSDETFACAGGGACGVQVPDTFEKFNTFSVTGDFALTRTLGLKAGGYLTQWRIQGIQAGPFNGVTYPASPLDKQVTRFDPHVALTLRPEDATSYRLSFGSSSTFPYAGIASGIPAYLPPSGTGSAVGTLNEKNPNLVPEHAIEADLGFDHRFKNGGVLSFDLASNVIHDVFENAQQIVNDPLQPQIGLINYTINAANLDSKLAMLSYRYEPAKGLGYFVNLTAARSIVNGVPLSAYPSAASGQFGAPANGVQQCSDGGSNVCVPYLKGYGRVTYTFDNGDYVGLGADFEGKNNTYFQPPFAIYDLVLKHPANKNLDVILSSENLFNTNVFGGLVRPNAGSPFTGENSSGQYGPAFVAGNLPYPLIPAQPRTVRLQLRWHINR